MIFCETLTDMFATGGNGETVLQVADGARDPLVVVHHLSEITSIPPYDLNATVRKHHGPIVLENLVPELARELARRLSEAGIATRAVPVSELMVPRLAGLATRLEYGSETLNAFVGTTEHSIPWDALALIAVAYVNGGLEHEMHVDAHDRAATERHLFADVFYALPDGCNFLRLEARHLSFHHLGERLQPTTLENFRVVLSDLTARSKEARLSPRCSKFVEGGPLPTGDALPNLQAFDGENLKELGLPW